MWATPFKEINEIFIDLIDPTEVNELMVRMLNSEKDCVIPPVKIHLFASVDGQSWTLAQIKDTPVFPNTGHDAFVDCVLFDDIRLPVIDGKKMKPVSLKLVFTCEHKTYIDEIFVNPTEIK